MIQSTSLERFSTQVSEHLYGFYLPFWHGPALDTQNGGWMGWLSNDLKPDRSQPKGLILNARILWAFSAAHQARPLPVFAEMAERALDVLLHQFWDAQYGGAFWRLDDAGKVADDSKKIYGQAFCLYALAEFHRAFGSQSTLERAQELFALIDRQAHDARLGGYVEVCRRDWSEAGPEARLSDKDMSEKKSMNNQLHLLEACTNLHRVWPDRRVAERLRELLEIFLTRILDEQTHHLHHFFDEHWTVRSDTYTFGHDIEASWLLCEAAEELGGETLLKRVRRTAVRMANTTFNEALGADGSICYEGKAGKIVDAGRECWPQAEALVGFLNAYEISQEPKFLAAALGVWDFIQHRLVDRTHGEWFWRINPDGQPDPSLPKVSEWKGPYHATRACLETLRRLERILEAGRHHQPI
jgi:mannobiose 2-epimerase